MRVRPWLCPHSCPRFPLLQCHCSVHDHITQRQGAATMQPTAVAPVWLACQAACVPMTDTSAPAHAGWGVASGSKADAPRWIHRRERAAQSGPGSPKGCPGPQGSPHWTQNRQEFNEMPDRQHARCAQKVPCWQYAAPHRPELSCIGA